MAVTWLENNHAGPLLRLYCLHLQTEAMQPLQLHQLDHHPLSRELS